MAWRWGTKSSRKLRPPGWKLTALETSRAASPGRPGAGTFVSHAGDRQSSMFPVGRWGEPLVREGFLSHALLRQPGPWAVGAAGPRTHPRCEHGSWHPGTLAVARVGGYFGMWLGQGRAALSVGGGGGTWVRTHRDSGPHPPAAQTERCWGIPECTGSPLPQGSLEGREHAKLTRGSLLVFLPPFPDPRGPSGCGREELKGPRGS